MKRYTLETLRKINEEAGNSFTEDTVNKANELVEILENSRDNKCPQIGDIVEYTTEYGDYYGNAHIDSVKEDKIYICERPYTPFMTVDFTGEEIDISFSTSGGAWTYTPRALKYLGKRSKLFKYWGGGFSTAILFYATVNVWEHIEGNHEFSTKTHDKFFLSIVNPEYPYGYKYLISKGGLSDIAFTSEEEYKAWLKTFKGVEIDTLHDNNHKIIWTYKQTEKCVPLEEYLSIENAVIDSTLCNGSIQECKRIYGKNHIETILPYQHDKIEIKTAKAFMRAY